MIAFNVYFAKLAALGGCLVFANRRTGPDIEFGKIQLF